MNKNVEKCINEKLIKIINKNSKFLKSKIIKL